MSRFAAHGADRHPTCLFVDIVKDAKRPYAQLPDGGNGFEWRHEIVQALASRGLNMRGVRQVRLDGIQKPSAIIRTESCHVVLHPFRKHDREAHDDA